MKPGLVLQGKYRLLAQLGEGGMGTVWRAENLALGGALAFFWGDALVAWYLGGFER